MKSLFLLCLTPVCFLKLSITAFEEQLDYPGMVNGTVHVNYTIKVDNPKEKEVVVDGVWVRGRWLDFEPKTYSTNPIEIRAFADYIHPDSIINPIPSPANKEDVGVVKYHIKDKSHVKYIGVEKIQEIESIARP